MKHLTKTDLVLFATNWERLSEDAADIKTHILTCDKCRTQLSKIRQALNSFRIQNEKHCNQYSHLLLDSLKSERKPNVTPGLQEHLEDCETCKQIFNVAVVNSPFDQADKFYYNISQHFLKQIDMKIYAELEKLDFSNYLTQTIDELATAVENNLRVLKLFLFPTPSLSGIRGKNAPEFFIFTHKGGKIQLQIGLANKDVKLFGIFEDKIFLNKSDFKGNVFFEDLPKDDYRVEVKGFAVSNIKTIV